MKTNELRKELKSQLSDIMDNVYYEMADENAMYPHCVFHIENRHSASDPVIDVTIDIDVWGKIGENTVADIEDMCDSIEGLFDNLNSPLANSLPTFYLDSRLSREDEDKKIIHRVVRITAQTYDKE